MDTKTQEAVGVRTITVVTTRGEKRRIPFEGTKWSELKSLLTGGGQDNEGKTFPRYDLNNMKCVESANRHTLEHPDAAIPEGNFNLFLMPYKTKSGSDRTDAYTTIQGLITRDGDSAKNIFNKDKNYTTKKTDELIELINKYNGTSSAPKKTSDSPTKAKAHKAVAAVVSSVKEAKSGSLLEKVATAISLLTEIQTELSGKPEQQSETPVVAAVAEKSEEQIAAEKKEQERLEAKEKQDEEDALIDKEFANTAKGFGDVRI